MQTRESLCGGQLIYEVMLEEQDTRLTELATPSWPLNLRMIRPVATSQEKTARSPPQDASLQMAEQQCLYEKRRLYTLGC